MKTFTLKQIAQLISGKIEFEKEIIFKGLNDLKNANKDQITFIGSRKFLKYWDDSSAGAAIVNESIKIENIVP